MRASKALMRGAELLLPEKGALINFISGSGCALGMMGTALIVENVDKHGVYRVDCPIPSFIELPSFIEHILVKNYSWIKKVYIQVPCTCYENGIPAPAIVWETIIHLFDFHVMTKRDWKIKMIAEWLDKVEPPVIPSVEEFFGPVEEKKEEEVKQEELVEV